MAKAKYGIVYNYICPDGGPSGQFLDNEAFTSKKAAQAHIAENPHGYFGMGTAAKVVEVTAALTKRAIGRSGDSWPGDSVKLRKLTAKEVTAFNRASELDLSAAA